MMVVADDDAHGPSSSPSPALFLKKSTGSAVWATGLSYHPAAKEYIISGTVYDTSLERSSQQQELEIQQQHQQQTRDSYCELVIVNPMKDGDDMESHLVTTPQVCMGGVVSVPRNGFPVAHIMGQTRVEVAEDSRMMSGNSTDVMDGVTTSTMAAIDTVIQPLLLRHGTEGTVNTMNNTISITTPKPYQLPQYTYPVASTGGHGGSVFVGLQQVFSGEPAFAEKIVYQKTTLYWIWL
jgi:hypothetical protein